MIVAATDDRYLDQAKVLIASCARHAPEQRFYLFLVNSTEARVAPFRRWHPRLIVAHTEWPYDPEKWRGRMCCARATPIKTVLKEYQEPTLYLDGDIVVTGSLKPLFATLEECDFTAHYKPDDDLTGPSGSPHGAKFNSGVMGFRPTDSVIRFVTEYESRMKKWIDAGKPIIVRDNERSVDSYIDQEFLYLAYEAHQDDVAFRPLEQRFNDSYFRRTSPIWHGKGTARRHPRFRRASLRYSNPALHAAAFPFLTLAGTLYDTLRTIKRTLAPRPAFTTRG